MLKGVKADLDAQDNEGKTAATYAKMFGHTNTLAWLKDANANLAAQDNYTTIDMVAHIHHYRDCNTIRWQETKLSISDTVLVSESDLVEIFGKRVANQIVRTENRTRRMNRNTTEFARA